MIISESGWKNKIYTFIVKYFDYFILIFVFTFFIVIYNSYFREYIEEINKINKERINLEQKIYIEQDQYLSKLKDAKKNLSNFSEEDKKRINAILPEGDQRISLFYYLDSLIRDNGMEMRSIKLSVDEFNGQENNNKERININKKKDRLDNIRKQISRLNIEIDIDGVDYEKMKMFLGALENNLRLIDVQSFNFLSLDEGELNIQAVAYYN